jgi:hypothetical protein
MLSNKLNELQLTQLTICATIYKYNSCNKVAISQKQLMCNYNANIIQLQLQCHVDITFHPSMMMNNVHLCYNSFATMGTMRTYYEMELHCHSMTIDLCTLKYTSLITSSSHGDYLEIETMDVHC